MDPHHISLDAWQVVAATLLILVNAGISIALRLRLERLLLLAAARTVGQLLLLGLILHWVFDLSSLPTILGLAAAMTLVAGWTATRRGRHRYRGIALDAFVSIWIASWVITAYALSAVVQADPWYVPRYSIPLLGMVLGNSLNGVSLGLASLTEGLVADRAEVETQLALGATRWEAAAEPIRRAVRTGTTPIVNSMMIVGIVSLPGMMTGQLLAGADAMDAVKYQIVIMFLIASATAMGTVTVVLLAFRRTFNHRHQFLDHVIVPISDRR